jgi:hypothetical protein
MYRWLDFQSRFLLKPAPLFVLMPKLCTDLSTGLLKQIGDEPRTTLPAARHIAPAEGVPSLAMPAR